MLAHPRVYSFLHVPVQSGSDTVLEDMRREYFVKDFRRVVDFLKERWVATRWLDVLLVLFVCTYVMCTRYSKTLPHRCGVQFVQFQLMEHST